MSSYEGGSELLPYDEWFTEYDNGRRLNSPVDGTPLVADDGQLKPPAFLLKNPYLKDSYDLAREVGEGLALGILYAVNETDRESLGPDYEHLMLREMSNVHAVGHTVDGTVDRGDGRLVLPDAARNAYTGRIADAMPQWAEGFCVGIETAYPGERLGRTERILRSIGDVAATQSFDPEDRGAGKWAMEAVRDSVQQWYRALRLAGQLGMAAIEFEDRDVWLQNVVLLAPAKDTNYTALLGSLGFRGGTQDARDAKQPDEQLLVPSSYTRDIELRQEIMLSGFLPKEYFSD